jgi:hypothetical protein
MLVRSPDLEDRIPDTTQLEIFTLPIEAAHRKAREIIDQFPQSGFIPIIEPTKCGRLLCLWDHRKIRSQSTAIIIRLFR